MADKETKAVTKYYLIHNGRFNSNGGPTEYGSEGYGTPSIIKESTNLAELQSLKEALETDKDTTSTRVCAHPKGRLFIHTFKG